jgi:hypothetical protein
MAITLAFQIEFGSLKGAIFLGIFFLRVSDDVFTNTL